MTRTREERAREAVSAEADRHHAPIPAWLADQLGRAVLRMLDGLNPKRPLPVEKNGKRLTGQQLAVLKLYARGYTSPQVARKLYLGESSVAIHRKNAIQAMGACNLASAIAKAATVGLIQPDDLVEREGEILWVPDDPMSGVREELAKLHSHIASALAAV